MSKKTLRFSVFFILGVFVFLISTTVPAHHHKGEPGAGDVNVFDLSLEELMEIEVYPVSEAPGDMIAKASPMFITFLELIFRYLCFLCFFVAVI